MAKEDVNKLSALLGFFLPQDMLNYFEVVDVALTYNDDEEKDLFPNVLDLYLDEKDNRAEEMKGLLKPNGFTEETVVNDFPVRDNKLRLHIRRRRWITQDGTNLVLDTIPLVAAGTRFSPELAAFLKEGDGQYASYSEVIGNLVRSKGFKG